MAYPFFARLTMRRLSTGLLVTGCCLAITACDKSDKTQPSVETPDKPVATAPTTPPVEFKDITKSSGVNSTYDNGESAGQRSIVESLGGGLGMFDFDLDGNLDLFFPGGGQLVPDQPLPGIPATLWRNLGQMHFTSCADTARVDQASHYTHGCVMGDYDSDGFSDILVTGYGGLTLFHNQGDGTFEEVAMASGMTSTAWSSSAAWADLDGDGLLDAFLANYVDWSWEKNPECHTAEGKREICSPQDFAPLLDLAYFNNGDGTFRAAAQDVGITDAGKGLGVVAVDVNQDSAIDIYVANDTTNNLLFMNDGKGNFKEMGVLSGTAYDQRGVSNGSMGLAVFDYDSNLQPDIWVTNYENETFALYHNDANGLFRCLTESTGITAIGTLYVGFGTVAADFTRSGYEDLIVSNGHVMMYPIYSEIQQDALYLRNDGRGRISRVEFPEDSYFSNGHRGRGVVAGDLDNDGKLDLAFSHVNEPATILQQTTPLDGQWLAIDLVGIQSNRDGVGASVVLETDKRKRFRTVIGGGSYLSQGPYTLWFGMPSDEKVLKFTITWPSGTVQSVEQPEINQRLMIKESK